MSIRNLIPPDAWKILKSKDPEIAKELKRMHYLVVCDTCKLVFLDITLDILRKEVAAGKWDLPRQWYVTAGKHWVLAHPNCLHEINAYLQYPSGTQAKVRIKGTERGLSEDWNYQLNDPKSRNYGMKPKQMLAELEHLEKQIS